MGSSGVKVVKPTKYFNDILLKKSFNINYVNAVGNFKEKIKLEFSLKNCSSKTKYNINAVLLEKEDKDFNTEEKIPNNNELTFDNVFICDYYFEREQKIQIIIYNEDSPPVTVMTTLAEIVASKHSLFVKQFENKEKLIVRAEKLGTGKSYINIKINIKINDPSSDYLIKNKLIFILNCKNRKIYSSESISDNGQFDQIKIPCSLLTPEYTVNICDPNNNDEIKGSYTKKLESIKNNQSSGGLQLKIPISKKITLSIYDNSEFKDNLSFFDYISSGVRLNLSIGIDFTGSNGHPLDKDTLHCILSEEPNDYEKVIKSIGDILSNYNYKKLYAVYGFGAVLNSSPYAEASMCFNINFNENPEIFTINNVLKVYRGCLDKMTFSGPTFFSPIINRVIETIRIKENYLEYNILLLLTDGEIDDMEATIDALVEGSFLPLSVIIVGIGNADFSKMVALDGNDTPLMSSQKIKGLRDIVQFIQYNNYKNNEQKMTREILEEIPKQMIEYYTLNNFNPEKIREIAKRNSIISNLSETQSNFNFSEIQNIQNNLPQNYAFEDQNNMASHSGPDLPTKSQIYNQVLKNESQNNINNNYDSTNPYINYGNSNNIPNQYSNINLSNFSNHNDLHSNESHISFNKNIINFDNNIYNTINLNNNNNNQNI